MYTSFTDWEGEHLEHYGVLGMKWHMHRNPNYQYQSHATKKYLRKAKKSEAKGELDKAAVFKNRAKRSAEIDRGEQDFARSLSTKKALGLSFLVGGSRLKAYAQNRAMSGQSGNNLTAKKLISAARAMRFETSGSRARKAAYIRQDEGRNTLGQKVFRTGNRLEDRMAAVADRKLAELQRRRRR